MGKSEEREDVELEISLTNKDSQSANWMSSDSLEERTRAKIGSAAVWTPSRQSSGHHGCRIS